ncbi:hypothetical protein HanRHA438_Chr13g0602551 [Helianthus annuus]|nr:hypothetical protein HanRHA438_Chr13g0602551 [Helianthus annuus]
MNNPFSQRFITGKSRRRSTSRKRQNHRRYKHIFPAKIRRIRHFTNPFCNLSKSIKKVPKRRPINHRMIHGAPNKHPTTNLRHLHGGDGLVVAGVAHRVVKRKERFETWVNVAITGCNLFNVVKHGGRMNEFYT